MLSYLRALVFRGYAPRWGAAPDQISSCRKGTALPHIGRGSRYVYPHATWQSEVAPITGPMYQLFVFFMITDPKTTVRTRIGQCVVAFCVALVEFCLRLNQVVYAPIYALFLVGPAANLIEIWLDSRKEARPGSEVSATAR